MSAVYDNYVPDLTEWLSVTGRLTINGEDMGQCTMRYPLNTRFYSTDIWCNGELVAIVWPEEDQGIVGGEYLADVRDDDDDSVHIRVAIESRLYCRQRFDDSISMRVDI